MLTRWFWRGFWRGITKPWSIFTDPPGYWEQRVRESRTSTSEEASR